jgi:CRISPR/Cas system-associated exonuclease Cas4 (RecB family)
MGWPAPNDAKRAIDDAEYDLATLHELFGEDQERSKGAARYLMVVNPHLARALRFRAARWGKPKQWMPSDGLVYPAGAARTALDEHRLAARSFSPTALESYAACPYRFYLRTIVGLGPTRRPEPIEQLGPLERGRLVHETQFELLRDLRDRALLPVVEANRPAAHAALDETLDRIAAAHEDELAPAIQRTWRDGVEQVRSDLHEWIRRMSAAPEWTPLHFELAFGLRDPRGRDAASTTEPVELDGGISLRGSIDLVERNGGKLRATDYKTGRVRSDAGIIGGGTSLQPLLYALALEKLLTGHDVTSGRLWYCTSRGRFEDHEVELGAESREAVRKVIDTVNGAIEDGFLPAAPAKDACERCDFVPVCGPDEELRTRDKDRDRLAPLIALRRHR